jgi:hypothetical protein
MRVIELDASQWTTGLDFYRELAHTVSGGRDVACNVNAILEYMVWDWEGMGGIQPPYILRIINATNLPPDVQDEIALVASLMKESQGGHLDVVLEWPPGALFASPEERLNSAETDLIGSWINGKDGLEADPIERRIGWLTKHYLREMATTPRGWDILYRDPNDDRYWELTYPRSVMQRAGPMRLTNIPKETARRKFGLPD